MRLFLSLAASILALTAASARAETLTPVRAADALDGIGVNTHLNYLDTAYANVQQVVAALKYIGVSQVRDASPSPWNPGAGPLSYYTYAMQQGIHFDFIAHCCQAGFGTDIGQSVDLLRQVPGGITALEGFNEVDMNPVTWMGQTGPQAAIAAQKDLYASVKGNATLKSLAVYDVTGVEHDLPVSLTGRADHANAHLYPQNGNQPNGWFKEMAGYAAAKKEPLVITEFGYASMPESGWLVIGVDPATQAKAVVNGVLSGLEQGVKRTYVYELLDQKPDPQNKSREWHFGLFTTDYKPKPAADMLSHVTTWLTDTSANRKTFALRPLNVTITGMPASGHKLFVERGDGTGYLVLWNEAPIWDRATGKPVASPTVKVTITVPSPMAICHFYDAAVKARPLGTYRGGTRAVTVDLPDHPIMIDMTGV